MTAPVDYSVFLEHKDRFYSDTYILVASLTILTKSVRRAETTTKLYFEEDFTIPILCWKVELMQIFFNYLLLFCVDRH